MFDRERERGAFANRTKVNNKVTYKLDTRLVLSGRPSPDFSRTIA